MEPKCTLASMLNVLQEPTTIKWCSACSNDDEKTTELKWRFSISTTDPLAFTSRFLPRKFSQSGPPFHSKKNSFRRVAQAIQFNNAFFLSCDVVSHEAKRKPACGISLQASVPSCLPPVMSGTKAPRHQRERSMSQDRVHLQLSAVGRSPTSTTLTPLIVHHVLKHSMLFNLNCAHISRTSTKMSVKPSET